MDLAKILTQFDDMLYTWLLIYLLAGSGIYFSVRTRFVQIRRFKDALRCMMEKKEGDKGVSYFQALMKKVNQGRPAYKQVARVVLRDQDFIRNTTKKIVRYKNVPQNKQA